ncbi:MAG TPA: DUF4760 domain-containing protein [Candidatus Tumulicola sp.]|nr:DUF4760 domain-containing protein [Candidatus Tumulicola sp.]
MSLEIINTFGTVTTVVIVAATAIAALVQLRHLRAGNQITALLAIQNELDSPDFREAELMLRHDLPHALEDPAFCAYCVAEAKRERPTSDQDHVRIRQASVLIANTYENLGALVKNGIFDRALFLDIYGWVVLNNWDLLDGFIAITRATTGNETIFENFEYIAAISRRYLDERPVTYPPGIPRLELHLPRAAAKLVT